MLYYYQIFDFSARKKFVTTTIELIIHFLKHREHRGFIPFPFVLFCRRERDKTSVSSVLSVFQKMNEQPRATSCLIIVAMYYLESSV